MGLQAHCPVCCCTSTHLMAIVTSMQMAQCGIADRTICLQTHWLILKLQQIWGELPQDMSVVQTGIPVMSWNLL